MTDLAGAPAASGLVLDFRSEAIQPRSAQRMGLRPTLDQQYLRHRGLDRFLNHYHTRRGHSALGRHHPSAGSPPDNNISGHEN